MKIMSLDVRTVINIAQFLLGVTASGLWGNLLIPAKLQLIDLGVYGLLLLNLLMVTAVFMGHKFKKNWLYLVCFFGAALSIVAAALLLERLDGIPKYERSGEYFNRLLSTIVFSGLLCVTYIIEVVFVYRE